MLIPLLAASKSRPPDDLALPDGLELLDRIGSGGAGEVYRVRELTGKLLALKVLHAKWTDAELHSLAAIRDLPPHPAIARIFHIGRLASGEVFYSMELADNAAPGKSYAPDTLARRIGAAPLPAADALRIVAELAAGVAHLHARGLRHGDIKPENVIFVDGSPKLIDFGTAAPGTEGGTVGFVPEDPGSPEDRDRFALGMTLYCAWTGMDACDYPALPETFDPKEGKYIRRIYHKAASRAAKRRFSSATDMCDALRKAEHALAPSQNIVGKNPLFLTLALLVAGLLSASVFLLCREEDRISGEAAPQTGSPDLITFKEREFYRKQSDFRNELRICRQYLSHPPCSPERFDIIRDFRKDFEKYKRLFPDAPRTKQFLFYQNFYAEADRANELYERMVGTADDQEKVRIFRESGYPELCDALNRGIPIRRDDFIEEVSKEIRYKESEPFRKEYIGALRGKGFRVRCSREKISIEQTEETTPDGMAFLRKNPPDLRALGVENLQMTTTHHKRFQ